ncbi:MAG: ABC transporter ATP-binding protein, partial [Deltaproteobacteria bacterium]|nr:ABC transporter ATP-binding protein [Deltaproteobacteria bacterium]
MPQQNVSKDRSQRGGSAPLEQAWRVLDCQVSELAKYCLPRRSQSETFTQTDNVKTITIRDRKPSQETFTGLFTENTLSAGDPGAELDDKPSIIGCINSSVGWAWSAGKGYLFARIATNLFSALVPYALTYSGARIVDALVRVSRGTSILAGSVTSELQASGPAVHELMQSAYTWFGVGVGVSVAMFASNAINRYVKSQHDVKINQEVMSDMREALTRFPPDEQFLPETTQLVQRTIRAQVAIRSFGEKLFELVVPSASVVGAVVIVAPHSPLGAALLGAFVIPYFYHSYKRGREEFSISGRTADPQHRFDFQEWNLLTGKGHVEIKLNGKMQDLLKHFKAERINIDELWLQPELTQQKRELWVQPLNTAVVSGVVFLVLADVVSKSAGLSTVGPSIGDYGMITGALYSLNASIRALASSLGEMLKNLPQAQLAHAVMRKGSKKKNSPQKDIYFDKAPLLKVENLYFSYPKSDGKEPCEAAISDISLDIKPGELICIVGESGSGKSSLVNILCGIYRPTKGRVMINGMNIEDVSRESLWACCGYLRQESTNLWSMTLRDNIVIGARNKLSDNEIMKLAKECGFAEVMERNKLTLHSVLGQWSKGGINLSGGEHALLALTR